MAKNRLKVPKHSYPIFQKKPAHRRLKNLTFWPYFLHFYDCSSGAQIIHLNCILQDLFRDTPLDHIWRAQIGTQVQPNTPNIVFGARI